MIEEKNIHQKFNVSCDLGHLLIYDNQPFGKDSIGESEMLERGKSNLKFFFEELFKLAKSQKGEDEEKRDFDKPLDTVILPKPETKLPRSKPIPKPKHLSKWEKYRVEKGFPAKQKRSRMIYSEAAGDWVPRWGKGSSKKMDESLDWAMEETKKGENPFEMKSKEKQLNKMKEKKKELKNYQKSLGEKAKSKLSSESHVKKNKKMGKNEKFKEKLKTEKKQLDKTLETGNNKLLIHKFLKSKLIF
jgi:regulator of ribosome biosynthesis